MIEDLIAIAESNAACGRYLRPLRRCATLKEAADLIFDPNGIAYVAALIANGTISRDKFDLIEQFCNGKYSGGKSGYTSSIWHDADSVSVDTTIALLVDCKEAVVDRPICELHIVGDCEIKGNGKAVAYWYDGEGKPTKIIYNG